MMNAVLLKNPGQPLAFSEVAMPLPGPDEVCVKVKAAALNHRDVWITKGQYPGIVPDLILGSDGAGLVEAVGENVPDSLIGKAVIINPSHGWTDNPSHQPDDYQILGLPKSGTFAEYVIVEAQYLIEKPAHLSFEEAAALPLAGLTAYRALFSRADLRAGERVLISGVGGGVALFAFQFALAADAVVFATSGSEEKLNRVLKMGATGTANYKEEGWAKSLGKSTPGFDVIIDSAGGEGFNSLINLAAPGGRIAFYGGTRGNIPKLNPQKIFWKQLSLLGSTMGNALEFKKMIEFVDAQKIHPVIDEVFPLEQAQQAFDRMDQGKQFGKIILQVG